MIKSIIKKLITNRVISFPRKIVKHIITYATWNKKDIMLYYNDPDKTKILKLIKQIKNETEMLLSNNEAYQLFKAVKRTTKIKGDIAEVGVYKGGSAKIICEAKVNKTLHLFDTFKGLPNLSKVDDLEQFYKGEYATSFEDVKNYLVKYSKIKFYKGIFPFTTKSIKNKKFSFVNLDVDIYESTLNCLKFFYPKMNKGGIILSHDYINAPGVRKAFDEFFENRPELIIKLWGSQCMIIKIN